MDDLGGGPQLSSGQRRRHRPLRSPGERAVPFSAERPDPTRRAGGGWPRV